MLDLADLVLLHACPQPGGYIGEFVDDAKCLGVPLRIQSPGREVSEWIVPADPGRSARHGFTRRGDLISSLDHRFAGGPGSEDQVTLR